MRLDPLALFRSFLGELPNVGTAGSRSAELHVPTPATPPTTKRLSSEELTRFATLRWMGTLGALMMGLGGLGAGAFPVVGNPYRDYLGGSFMSRMLTTSSIIVLMGVGFLVLAWVMMWPFISSGFTESRARNARRPQRRGTVPVSLLRRTFIAWVAPIWLTAPMFTQDIYSYLAQGSIVAHGMDPYEAGPIDLLGPDNVLARSVPFIWSHSPSPYGPVALGIAAAISKITSDNIILGVIAHRSVSLAGVILAGWAIVKLARRCGVGVSAALWLGILNPLTILHLIGGIHNESVLLGLALVGMEVGLRGVDKLEANERGTALGLLALGGVLISYAGLVKVTGFLGLGFLGMALARALWRKANSDAVSTQAWAIIRAAVFMTLILGATIALATWVTGIGLGWITGQGGAATIRSWMSISTDIGVVFGQLGMLLGLGDQTDAMLSVTRAAGVLLAGAFMVRMLFATFKGTIHPVGAFGVSTLVLVFLFPVVHPWYILWALLPLAAWANRALFRVSAVIYSALFSFFVLPRGLALPPSTILSIYLGAALCFAVLISFLFWRVRTLNLR